MPDCQRKSYKRLIFKGWNHATTSKSAKEHSKSCFRDICIQKRRSEKQKIGWIKVCQITWGSKRGNIEKAERFFDWGIIRKIEDGGIHAWAFYCIGKE